MAITTLGKRTRSSKQEEPIQSLDFSAKRPRRTLKKISEKEHISVHDKENQENPQLDSDSQEEAAPTPTQSQSRRTSIASTVRSSNVAPVTPSTPRHYDVFARGTTTPRHRVMSVGRLSKRMTPQTPLTPTTVQTVYHQARQLFSRSADPGQLIGRDDERTQLETFLGRCKTSRPGGCLYVSGPPGTGKSAIVNKITEEVVSESDSIKKAYVNCMSIKSSKDLYITLLDQLSGDADMSEGDVVEALEKLLLGKKTTDVFLVVLDEIDHILTMDPESLYRVFEWSLQKTSRLALVGIANALDLTDRFLPRLKSRNLKPELLPILPYTAPQVKRIITERLKSLAPKGATPDFIPFFHPAAIELCSRKVSSQTGDLRRAFEICRRALDLVETETRLKHENEIKDTLLQQSPSRKAKILGENRNLASSPRTPSMSTSLTKSLQTLTVSTAPRVTIGHLNKITAAAFSNGATQRLKTLNLQQKAALCSLMAMEKRNRAAAAAQTPSSSFSSSSSSFSKSRTAAAAVTAAPTIKSLYDAYCTLCTQDSLLHPLSSSEFREVVGSLETLSLIAPVDGKNGSLQLQGAAAAGASAGATRRGGGGLTPTGGRGRRKKDVFAFGGGTSGVVVDEKRVASCVGEREMEAAVEGMGAGILRGILSGEALD
ncbi:P-loop containing nucleoside triphosphate hydrolase protein [Chaetomidium leptoderma]|uniref:Cell division control protein n=1 Tax=Chaetomidium leptoderma TaxID=669021 RepID=A0AAN7A0G6_9PEZI|nr:P-loop containing nucleoside triphosphate hydrolase protein [Chaetomidium leptoderma]